MQELDLIGIGTGNPEHVTLEAIRVMRGADVILIPRKGSEKSDLADLRRQICAVHLGADAPIVEFDLPVRDASGDYLDGVSDWHDAIAGAWRAAVPRGARRVALLIWGDPSLYDSALRIADRLQIGAVRVVPGITSLQMLTAAHAIPLNDLGAPVVITTGRRLRESGWPQDADRVAVMLDGQCSFDSLPAAGLHIWWGAYVGMDHQLLIAGPLADVGAEIIAQRAEARARHGWIMDIYLLARQAEHAPPP